MQVRRPRPPRSSSLGRYHPPVPDLVTIRLALAGDIPQMQAIEIAAGRLFAEIGMHDVAEDGAHETDVLAGYVAGGRAWVAARENAICGYALADLLDGTAHLEQVTVHPDQGRQRIGGRLIDTVSQWARDQGLDAMTLLTFRDVAWNGPYYRRLGFVDLPDAALGPELAALRAHEAELGLDVIIRGAMRLTLR
jgi:GNAT superfamily N-acetyltransferase